MKFDHFDLVSETRWYELRNGGVLGTLSLILMTTQRLYWSTLGQDIRAIYTRKNKVRIQKIHKLSTITL